MGFIPFFVSGILWTTIVMVKAQENLPTEKVNFPMETYGFIRDCGVRAPDYHAGIAHPGPNLLKFPWLAKILYSDREVAACGGVLISEEYVLSTKTCIESDLVAAVLLGEYDPGVTDWRKLQIEFVDIAQRIFVNFKVLHPMRNIGLINLKRLVRLTVYVHPICLPWCKKVQQTKDGEVSGWSHYDRESKTLWNSYLHTHPVRIVPGSSCLGEHEWPDEQFCVEGTAADNECRGMPGGPLMMTEKLRGQERYVVVGLQSDERLVCGISSEMGFVNVTYNMDWILQNLDKIRH